VDLSGSSTRYDLTSDSLGNLYLAGEQESGTKAKFINRDDYGV